MTTMTKTKALELLTVALKDQRKLYTYGFVLADIARFIEQYERKEVDAEIALHNIARSLNVYRYEMQEEK